MSTKTIFKRIALVAVASIGLGVLSVGPSSAAVTEETLTVSAATATGTVGDTTTVTVTSAFIASVGAGATADSRTINAVVQGVNNAGTASVNFVPTSDSANTVLHNPVNVGTAYNTRESVIAVTAGAYTKNTSTLQLINFTVAGTYNVTITSKDDAGTIYKSAVVVVTVSAVATTTATGGYVWLTADIATSQNARIAQSGAIDSAIVVSAGTAATPVAVGYAFAAATNSAGDTRAAGVTGLKNSATGTPVNDTFTVTVTGPGLVSGVSTTKAKTAQVQVQNGTATNVMDTLTIWSDGTAGVSTLKWTTSLGVLF